MKRSRKIVNFILFFGGLSLFALVVEKSLTAAFSVPESVTHVQIDGVDFGVFDEISGLEQLATVPADATPSHYTTVTLKRDFVTDPSLYLWAKNRRSKKSELKNVHLVKKSMSGRVLSRQILEFCQPLSWTVEKANPSLGGFNETVDLAVQKVTYSQF